MALVAACDLTANCLAVWAYEYTTVASAMLLGQCEVVRLRLLITNVEWINVVLLRLIWSNLDQWLRSYGVSKMSVFYFFGLGVRVHDGRFGDAAG
jgi:hypothetical protein